MKILILLFFCFFTSANIRIGSSDNLSHIFIGTKPLQKIYLVKHTTASSFDITFERLTGPYYLWSEFTMRWSGEYSYLNNRGSSSPSLNTPNMNLSWCPTSSTFCSSSAFNRLSVRFHTDPGFSLVAVWVDGNRQQFYTQSNTYYDTRRLNPDFLTSSDLTKTIRFEKTDGSFLSVESTSTSQTLVWKNTDPPVITAFSVSPTTIDLDTRPTGDVSLSFTATAQSGKTQTGQLFLEPQGTMIGQTYVSGSGVGLSESGITTPQPDKNQTYRVVVRNAGGASHRDATVTVTQNPVVSNLEVAFLGDRQGGTGGTIRIRGRVKGYPRPEVSVSPGWTYLSGTNHISARHFTPVSGLTNTWAFETTQYHGANPGQVTYTVTGTNSSGSGTGQVILR